MIVLDTNTLSERKRPAPEAAIEQWLADQPEANVFISAITELPDPMGCGIEVATPWVAE